MKLAVDTNVLVRYLVYDDAAQVRRATAQIESAQTVFLSTIVLCETVWVLKRAYRYSNEELAETLSALIHSRNIETDRTRAEAGLQMLARGGDFADGAIEQDAIQAKCERLATFDQTFEQLLSVALRKGRGAH